MASLWRNISILLLLWTAVSGAFAAAPSSAEKSDWNTAQSRFDTTFYADAEKFAADFAQKYTNSIHLSEAFLLQARARFAQSNYVGAAELLSSHFNPRDPLADDYLYYLGLAQGKRGQYLEAATTFARLEKEYPISQHLLEASIQEAAAYSMIPDWRHAIELLSNMNGVFQAT